MTKHPKLAKSVHAELTAGLLQRTRTEEQQEAVMGAIGSLWSV